MRAGPFYLLYHNVLRTSFKIEAVRTKVSVYRQASVTEATLEIPHTFVGSHPSRWVHGGAGSGFDCVYPRRQVTTEVAVDLVPHR